MLLSKLIRCILLSSLSCLCRTNADWHSSLHEIEYLVRYEPTLLTSLNIYLCSQKCHAKTAKHGSMDCEKKLEGYNYTRFEQLEQAAAHLEQISTYAMSDTERYVAHPVNAYHLIRRFAVQWKALIAENGLTTFENGYKDPIDVSAFPDASDVAFTARAIATLQLAYDLRIDQLARGNISGYLAFEPLSRQDCFLVALEAHKSEEFQTCASWMSQVLDMDESVESKPLDGVPRATDANVLEYLVQCNEASLVEEDDDDIMRVQRQQAKRDRELAGWVRNDGAKFCAEKPPNPTWLLQCRYWTNGMHPQLIISPIKMEELWDSPRVLRFYDVITDAEADELKVMSWPDLTRSKIVTKDQHKSSFRVCKCAFLERDRVSNIYRRLSHVTGLSVEEEGYENMQVINYGPGGYYGRHLDEDGLSYVPGLGNRIATFMLYLSDVPLGGHTCFPHLDVCAAPVKRSALFWYNLLPDGAADWRTDHAACPVVVGNKWIANQWVHELEQTLRRKCPLRREADYDPLLTDDP